MAPARGVHERTLALGETGDVLDVGSRRQHLRGADAARARARSVAGRTKGQAMLVGKGRKTTRVTFIRTGKP